MKGLLLLLVPSLALADDEARRHFDQGVALFRDHDYDAALAEFQRSNQLTPLPIVRYNIALSEKALGRFAEAIDDFRAYEASPMDPLARSVARELEELQGLVAPLSLTLSPAGAQLRLDGHTVAVRDPMLLSPGRHVLTASQPGYQPATIELSAEAREPLSARLELQAIVVALPAPTEIKLALIPPPRKTPVWHRWYFWVPLAAVVAGVVGLGVGLGVTALDPIPGTLDPGTKKLNH